MVWRYTIVVDAGCPPTVDGATLTGDITIDGNLTVTGTVDADTVEAITYRTITPDEGDEELPQT